MITARRWLPPALLIALLAGSLLVGVQQRLDAALADYRTEEQLLYLSSGEWVKRLSLGYDGLMACLYWTRAVQHFGRQRLGEKEYKLLYPLLDITTTLDPQLILAYRFGALFLTEKPPGGPGRPDQAVALLEKGIRENRDYWRFWYDLGFVYYRGLQDYPRAAAAFYKGAQHPDAAPWMRVMAAKVEAEGGTRDHARFLWTELYNSTDDPIIRQSALSHLIGLRVDDEIEFLQGLVSRYQQETGKLPASFAELATAGIIRGQPLDPLGNPYQIAPDGRVLLDPQSPIITSTLGRRE
jgi:tetratricopeptide (TPR) repeat protein